MATIGQFDLKIVLLHIRGQKSKELFFQISINLPLGFHFITELKMFFGHFGIEGIMTGFSLASDSSLMYFNFLL